MLDYHTTNASRFGKVGGTRFELRETAQSAITYTLNHVS